MFYRVVQVMRGGTPLPKYPGSIEACQRKVKREGGHIEVHCPEHGWVVGETCAQCKNAAVGEYMVAHDQGNGTYLKHYIGESLAEAKKHIIDRGGGVLCCLCHKHGWVPGETCPYC